MTKDIFSNDQERQILKAFDDIDADIGVDKLNDEEGLQRIFRGDIEKISPNNSKKNSSWLEMLGLSWLSKAGEALVSPSYVLASSVVILSLIPLTIFQAYQLQDQKVHSLPDPLRGAKEIYQIVDSPEQELLKLTSSLVTLGVSFEVGYEHSGAIRLTLDATEEVEKLLFERRIVTSKATQYVLIFEKPR